MIYKTWKVLLTKVIIHKFIYDESILFVFAELYYVILFSGK